MTEWPEYNATTQSYLMFDGHLASFPVERRYAASGYHFWTELVPLLSENCMEECPRCDDDHTVGRGTVVYPSIFFCYSLLIVKGFLF